MDVQPTVLICYANPLGTDRLRLDKEHRMIDTVLSQSNADTTTVKRIHATTIQDIADSLRDGSYRILQFSGHGNSDSIYLEHISLADGQMIPCTKLATLINEFAPDLDAIICMSCFSSDSIPSLVNAAAFLITVSGPADDDSAIDFLQNFYVEFFKKKSIIDSFHAAKVYRDFNETLTPLNTVLSRRATESSSSRVIFHVFPGRGSHHSICVDITEAEKDIEKLVISREEFLSMLTRKIQVHRWIFAYPRERALIQLDRYFGFFSWSSENDIVSCHEIISFRDDAPQDICDWWAWLILMHNDSYIESYRLTQRPAAFSQKSALEEGISTYKEMFFERLFVSIQEPNPIQRVVPDHFKATKSSIKAYLDLADAKHKVGDFRSTVIYLECILSAIHDLIKAISVKITVGRS